MFDLGLVLMLINIYNISIFNNNTEGICVCCKINSIFIGNFDCGHITSRKDRGKMHIDNLRPICKPFLFIVTSCYNKNTTFYSFMYKTIKFLNIFV